MKVVELQGLASSLGIKGTGKMRKSDLIDAIKARQSGTASAAPSSSTTSTTRRTQRPAETPQRSEDSTRPAQRQDDSQDRRDGARQQDRQDDRQSARQGTASQGERDDRQGARRDDQDGRDNRQNNRQGEGRQYDNRQGDNRQQRSPGGQGQHNQGPDDGEGGGRRRRNRNRSRNRDKRRGRGEGMPPQQDGENLPQVSEDDVLVPVAGLLEVLDNYAFVRTSGYLAGPNDIYVPLGMVKRFGLRKGDAVTGQVKAPNEDGQSRDQVQVGSKNNRQKYNPLARLDTVNGMSPEEARRRPEFSKLTPLYPQQRLRLETEPTS